LPDAQEALASGVLPSLEEDAMDTILIVDDDAVSLTIYKTILAKKFDIKTCRSGIQAMGYLKDNPPPDLIVSDIYMPGLGGLDMLTLLKEQEQTKDIPVILCTGLSDVEVLREGYRRGAAEIIVKPIVAEALLNRVRLILEWGRMRKENEWLCRELQEILERVQKTWEQIAND